MKELKSDNGNIPDVPDGIEPRQPQEMKFWKVQLLHWLILTITLLFMSVSYAQGILGGIFQAAAERYIDNSSYSSQDKENMRNVLNYFSSEANANQNARNATRDAYQGNYTGAVIHGAQTLLNAMGNYDYDTFLNSANAVNNANREYNQDVSNGMDRQEALDKRNEVMGYSIAESVIELQDKVARERIEKARQQRELERQSWESNNNYTTYSYNDYDEAISDYDETTTKTASSNPNVYVGSLIAHVNTSAVLDAMPDKAVAEKVMENYYRELQNQLQVMVNEYQTKMQDYEDNQATMSSFVRQSKEKEIVDLQNRIQQFQKNAEVEFEAKRVDLLNPILNKIQNAINAVSSENGLSYVIDISTGAAVFLGEDSIDITYMVMKKLGI